MRREQGEAAARILDAADEILGEVGYEGMSIGAVAERAGVNKALVFYYYESKTGLLAQVLERYYAAHAAALEQAFAGGGSLSERLHRVVDAYVSYIAENRRYPRLVQQLVSGDAAHAPLIREGLAPLFAWTTSTLSEIAPETGPLSARHLFVTFSGMVINYFTYAPVLGPLWGEDPSSAEALAERRAHLHWMVDLVLEGLERDFRRAGEEEEKTGAGPRARRVAPRRRR